jgi:hypothetical protein
LDRWLVTLVELEQNCITPFVVLILALVLCRFLNRLFTLPLATFRRSSSGGSSGDRHVRRCLLELGVVPIPGHGWVSSTMSSSVVPSLPPPGPPTVAPLMARSSSKELLR